MKILLSCAISVSLLGYGSPTCGVQEKQASKQASQQTEATASPREPLTFGLEDGTPVRLRINRTISSEDAKVGDTVDFDVLEDVKFHDVIIIPRGNLALATITEAQSKRRMGRAGKLSVNIDDVKIADGEKIPLRAVKDAKGGSHVGAMTGAIVATSIVFFPAAPLFLFVKGKDITIPKGTEITAYVSGDISLDPKKFQPPYTARAEAVPAAAAPAIESPAVVVILQSEPPGAEITVDGKYVGNTPTILHPTVGDHAIRVEKTGYKPWERTVTITLGESTTIDTALEKMEAPATQ